MTTITLNDALQARIRAVAAPEEDLQDFLAAALELVARRERRATAWAAAQAEAQAILNGPPKLFDPGATYRKYAGEVRPARSLAPGGRGADRGHRAPDRGHAAGETGGDGAGRLIVRQPDPTPPEDSSPPDEPWIRAYLGLPARGE